jgi:hypothetical protein
MTWSSFSILDCKPYNLWRTQSSNWLQEKAKGFSILKLGFVIHSLVFAFLPYVDMSPGYSAGTLW